MSFIVTGLVVVFNSLYKLFFQLLFCNNFAWPVNAITFPSAIFIGTGCSLIEAGTITSKTFWFGKSADSKQYTTGPRFTVTRFLVSSTSGLLSISATGISKVNSILSPVLAVPEIKPSVLPYISGSFPLKSRLYFLHHPGIRKWIMNGVLGDSLILIVIFPSHG